jgi:hypothetical protein
MTHPEVRAIAEEALRLAIAPSRGRLDRSEAEYRVMTVLKCEDESGMVYWRIGTKTELPTWLTPRYREAMRAHMKERFEIQTGW